MARIRKVQKADIPIVKDLLSTTWIDTYSSFLSPETIERVTTEWHNPDRLALQIEDEKTFFACIESRDGKIAGVITITKIDPETLSLHRLYIDPQMQRQGLGRELLLHGIAHFPEAKKVRVEVEKLNKKGRDFYIKNGFSSTGEKEDIVGEDRMEVLVMEKTL